MNKRLVSIVLSLVVIVASFSVVAGAATVKNPEKLVVLQFGNAETLDPHWAYDSASGMHVENTYESLFQYPEGDVSTLAPLLATKVPTAKNGLIKDNGKTYVFPIREGVVFHNGNKLTPEDVKYSFMRAIFQNRVGGPTWMLIDPIFGLTQGRLENIANMAWDDVDKAPTTDELEKILKNNKDKATELYNYVESHFEIDGNKVIVHMEAPYPPFTKILTRSNNYAGGILDKEWSKEIGAWNGTPEDIGDHFDPAASESAYNKLENMNGTGPYEIVEFQNGEQTIWKAYDNYWRENAALETIVFKAIDEWSTRKLMFLRGDADLCIVDPQYLQQVQSSKEIRAFPGLRSVGMRSFSFNWDINMKGNDYVGSGKLDGNGIPSDFFNNVHVRRAFSYAFNYDVFIEQVMRGNAVRISGPSPAPLAGAKVDPMYELNLEKAKEEFKKAYDGKLWEKGFKMTILYNTGNLTRKSASDMLKTYVEQVNPKFDVKVRSLQWSTFLSASRQGKLPISLSGWAADFPDAHNFMQPLLHSGGYYAGSRGDAYKEWAKENIDPKMAKGMKILDKEERREYYAGIQDYAQKQAIDIWGWQGVGTHLERKWIKGYYYNPLSNGYWYKYEKMTDDKYTEFMNK
jgi:peptide/nickel transport system substrate-binding protein